MEARKAVLNIREGRPPCTAPPPHVGGYFPFIGRLKECQHLRELHARRKCALIRGPAGIGKSELVAHLRQELELLICPRTTRFGEICESFEPELRLSGEGLRLLPRKKQLRQALRSCGRTVVFDGVGWTTPKLSSFLESVAERTPVWICARSEHPWDIGHIWPLLVRFERVELRPFHPTDTQALVEAAAQIGIIPREARIIAEWLHRRSAGNPLVLHKLIEELATGKYDLSNSYALRRLDLDRRIHEIFPVS